jgi:hypothetical protein
LTIENIEKYVYFLDQNESFASILQYEVLKKEDVFIFIHRNEIYSKNNFVSINGSFNFSDNF